MTSRNHQYAFFFDIKTTVVAGPVIKSTSGLVGGTVRLPCDTTPPGLVNIQISFTIKNQKQKGNKITRQRHQG